MCQRLILYFTESLKTAEAECLRCRFAHSDQCYRLLYRHAVKLDLLSLSVRAVRPKEVPLGYRTGRHSCWFKMKASLFLCII